MHDERAGLQSDEAEEGGVDLILIGRLQDMEVNPLCSCRFQYVLNEAFGIWIVRVHQQAIDLACGTSTESSSSRLAFISAARMLTSEAGNDPVAGDKRDRDCRGRISGRPYGREGGCHNHVDLAADKLSGHCRQLVIATLRPAVFDRHVPTLDVAGVA